ncbi:MAG: cytochrome P450 [Paracoccus sp.]|nr:cytochrome P450 [Paracoccus sp. (in: a-proteobacteria)]
MVPGFDPASPDFGRDPWPVYAAIRALPELPWLAGFEGHVAARFHDVSAIASDRRMVRGAAAFAAPGDRDRLRRAENFHDMPFHERFVQTSMLELDGADHDRLRRAVFPFFTKTRLESLRDWVADHLGARLDALLSRERIDFVTDLAHDLPGQVIGHLIGTDPAMARQMTEWSEAVVTYFDVSNRTPARKARAEQATRLFHDLLRDLCAQRRIRPRDDLTSALTLAEARGQMSGDEVISTLMQLLHAGHGSTVDAMGNGMAALLAHPDQMARLRADRALMPQAVQEMFRHAAPLPFFHRYASVDLTICGRDWPRGTKFGLLYASANRDPAAFEGPDRFDVTRRPNLHLAFGAGPHVCLGNNLARLNMEVLFDALLARTTRIEAAGEATWKTGLQAHGPTSLPVALSG